MKVLLQASHIVFLINFYVFERVGKAGPDTKNGMKIEVTVPEISRVENRGLHQIVQGAKRSLAVFSTQYLAFRYHLFRNYSSDGHQILQSPSPSGKLKIWCGDFRFRSLNGNYEVNRDLRFTVNLIILV